MNLKKGVYYPYIGLWYSLTSRCPIGTNIYENEWDVAIILDTCRVDALKEVQNEYEFINSVGSTLSVGSSTPEWLINTFSTRWKDQIRRTTRVSGNAFDDYILVRQSDPHELDRAPLAWPNFSQVKHSAFDHLEILYQGDFHDERLGTVPPDQVTKRGIAVGRERDWDLLMLHYIQPHAPYIADAIQNEDDISETESRPMWALRSGHIDRATGWEMYLDNLRLALDSVEILLENLDAQRVVLTADHGESFGEYGGKFGHIDGYLTPQVRKVPWVTTTAEDEETVIPEPRYYEDIDIQTSEFNEDDLRSHLEDLGYF
jgi:hypothetical protein